MGENVAGDEWAAKSGGGIVA